MNNRMGAMLDFRCMWDWRRRSTLADEFLPALVFAPAIHSNAMWDLQQLDVLAERARHINAPISQGNYGDRSGDGTGLP